MNLSEICTRSTSLTFSKWIFFNILGGSQREDAGRRAGAPRTRLTSLQEAYWDARHFETVNGCIRIYFNYFRVVRTWQDLSDLYALFPIPFPWISQISIISSTKYGPMLAIRCCLNYKTILRNYTFRLACVQEQRLPITDGRIGDGRISPGSSQSSTFTGGPSSEEFASDSTCPQTHNKVSMSCLRLPNDGSIWILTLVNISCFALWGTSYSTKPVFNRRNMLILWVVYTYNGVIVFSSNTHWVIKNILKIYLTKLFIYR